MSNYTTSRLIDEVDIRGIRTYRQARTMTREQLITLLDNANNRRSQGTF